MRKICYYVATSIDGYISGPNGDVSGFAQGGDGVETYLKDLQSFDTVIMGRKTYEFGYPYGLEPGQPAYPHMKNYVFSNNMQLESKSDQLKICPLDINIIKGILAEEGSDVYLCGGGDFANWLLEHEMIHTLKLKLNPFVQGSGVRLFGNSTKVCKLELIEHQQYEQGLQIITYSIGY